MKTEDRIILVVIVTIAGCAGVYVLATGWLAVVGAEPKPTVAQAFNHVGDVLIGALIGLLMKTRPTASAPGDDLGAAVPVKNVNTALDPVITQAAPPLQTPKPPPLIGTK